MAEKVNLPGEVPQKHPPQPGVGGKSVWEELVGLSAEEAERKIKEETPENTCVHVLPSDSFVTMDFRKDRVRIFIESSGKVVKPPKIG